LLLSDRCHKDGLLVLTISITIFFNFTLSQHTTKKMANKGNRGAMQLAATLDKAERARLRSFLDSPYCTGLPVGHDCLVLLHHTLIDLEQKEGEVSVEDEVLWEKAFSGVPYAKNTFNRWMHKAYQLVRKFVLFEMADREWDEREQELLILKYFNQKGNDKKFWATRESIVELQRKKEEWVGDQYLWNYRVELEETMRLSAFNHKKGDLNLIKTLRSLDEFFLLERCYLTCVLLFQNQVTSLALPPFEQLIPIDIESERLGYFFNKPLGRLMYLSLKFLREGVGASSELFSEYLDLLSKSEGHIPFAYLDSFETSAINYLVREWDQGNASALPQLFQIYLRRFEKKRIYKDGGIPFAEFQSVATVALLIKEYSWAYDFLTSHKDRIKGTEHPEDAYRYNLANYHFFVREFQTAYEVLFPYKYEEMHYKIASKILEIKILYQLRESQWLDARIEAAKVFLSREDKIPSLKKELYVNFVNMMKQILHSETAVNSDRAQQLISKVKETKLIADRAWLLEKLEAILEKIGKRKG